MKRAEGETFEQGGCLWIVEKAYTKADPDLFYKDRIAVKCIRTNPSDNTYKVGDTLDYANV